MDEVMVARYHSRHQGQDDRPFPTWYRQEGGTHRYPWIRVRRARCYFTTPSREARQILLTMRPSSTVTLTDLLAARASCAWSNSR